MLEVNDRQYFLIKKSFARVVFSFSVFWNHNRLNSSILVRLFRQGATCGKPTRCNVQFRENTWKTSFTSHQPLKQVLNMTDHCTRKWDPPQTTVLWMLYVSASAQVPPLHKEPTTFRHVDEGDGTTTKTIIDSFESWFNLMTLVELVFEINLWSTKC